MRRVFADSSILIAGSGSRTGASRAVLTMAEIGLFKLVISQQVLDECDSVSEARLSHSPQHNKRDRLILIL